MCKTYTSSASASVSQNYINMIFCNLQVSLFREMFNNFLEITVYSVGLYVNKQYKQLQGNLTSSREQIILIHTYYSLSTRTHFPFNIALSIQYVYKNIVSLQPSVETLQCKKGYDTMCKNAPHEKVRKYLFVSVHILYDCVQMCMVCHKTLLRAQYKRKLL